MENINHKLYKTNKSSIMENIQEPNFQIFTLDGVEEIGRNCYGVSYKKEIIMIDCGISFSSNGIGFDARIPDVTWFIQNKKFLKGIIITHAHLDHVGALPYVIKELGFPPIYGSQFTIEFIRRQLKEYKLDQKVKLNIINRNGDVKLSHNLQGEFFGVTHSIPHSTGVCIRSPEGSAVYTGDFKLDDTPIAEPPTNYKRIAEISKRGVTALLIDSTNIFTPGRASSESEVKETLFKLIKTLEGRVIIATFASMVSRLYSFLEIAEKTNRRVFVTGRSLANNLKIALAINYVPSRYQHLFINTKQLTDLPDNQVMVLCTGSQAEPMAALTRITKGEHQSVHLKKGDSVVMASSTAIPSNVEAIIKLQDRLTNRGIAVYSNKMLRIHSSGHANSEELLQVCDLFKPTYVIPVHGPSSFRAHFRTRLAEQGFAPNNVLLTHTGGHWGIQNSKIISLKKIQSKDKYIVHNKVLAQDDSFVRSRLEMSEGGVIVFVLLLNKSLQLKSLRLVIRGVRPKQDLPEFTKKLTEKFTDWYRQTLPKVRQTRDPLKVLRSQLYRRLGIWFHRGYHNKPLLLIEIIEV